MNSLLFVAHRLRFFSHWSPRFCSAFLALTAIVNAQLPGAISRFDAGVSDSPNQLSVSLTSNVLMPPDQHSSIMVTINPRVPPGGTGSATVEFRNGNGEVLIATAASFGGLAIGVRGPQRNVRFGDTPFGVYKFVRPEGGAPDSEISPGYGTGKLYLDDDDMFGEVVDAHRGTIRLHGGGSGLEHPYAPDQQLVPTHGCLRMKNRDINALIQSIKALPPEQKLEFIFMGSETYLRTLATNTTLSDKPWWNVLRKDLQLPLSPPAEMVSWRVPSVVSEEVVRTLSGTQEDAQLIELVRTFAEDSGPRGRAAFSQLQQRTDSLAPLQNSVPANDALRPMIAFALCFAGRDCGANIAVIQSAFKKPSPFKGFYADQAQDMLSRLADQASQDGRQNDVKNLIVTLLTAAPEADGALSEGLGVTLSLKLRDQTGSFVSAFNELAATPGPRSQTIRTSALGLIRAADYLTRNELTNITSQINSNPNASAATKSTFTQFRGTYLQGHQRDRQ